ncbi:MAG: hypothetical protein AB1735_03245 [Pseudomonadota bacterium]
MDARPKGASGETEAVIVIETQQEFIIMQMKQVVLALAATGVLSSQALAVEGWDAEAPGVQPVQVALVVTEAALPEQVALVEQEPAAQVAELGAKLPAVLPELPAALAVAEPAPFSAADMQALFVPSTEPLRVAVLSAQEMEETQGALAPFAVGGLVGAGLGGGGFAWGVLRGHHPWNTGRFIGNVATGAAFGAGFGAAGAMASGGARFIPSLTNAGANIWRFNSLAANNGFNRAWRR